MRNIGCTFTGHEPMRFRFGYDEEDELCQQIKAAMKLQVLALYDNGITDFYTNCEPGASMWGAELILDLINHFPHLKLYCVIPYEEQAKKWTPQLRDRYYTILEKSTYNYLISTKFEKSCYLRCNEYLVNHTGLLLSVYKDQSLVLMEPAAHLVTYARKQNKGVILIDPDTAEVTPITVKEGKNRP